jgi:hypothetical protein
MQSNLVNARPRIECDLLRTKWGNNELCPSSVISTSDCADNLTLTDWLFNELFDPLSDLHVKDVNNRKISKKDKNQSHESSFQ